MNFLKENPDYKVCYTDEKWFKNNEQAEVSVLGQPVTIDILGLNSNVNRMQTNVINNTVTLIDETAPTTSITSTAGDGNVVDMGLRGLIPSYVR